ncbi:DUF6446 family protein [Rhodosalinus sp.]|uniref:DUF6446 family protein n=1 Tax=Rhodosalinus sp. TaxID=2047741 RepID=UPI00397A6E03
MSGRLVALVLIAAAVIGGGALYWLQIYAFYEPLAPTGPEDVQVALAEGGAAPLPHADFRGIDSDSSPIRYRACFTLAEGAQAVLDSAAPARDPEPLVAPGWFDCFDATAVAAALDEGTATAYAGAAALPYGIDRVVAVFEDGRGVAWNQINACGAAFFDGDPLPPHCPPPPAES